MEDTDNSTEVQETDGQNTDIVTTVNEQPAPAEEQPATVVEQPATPPMVLHDFDEPDLSGPTPNNVARKIHADHFCVIMNKIAIFAMIAAIIIMVGEVVAFFAAGIGMLLLIMFLLVITVGTLGIVLLDENVRRWWGYIQHFDEITDTISRVFAFLYMILPYLSGIGIVCAIISLIGFGTNKSFRHPTRKVMAIISIVILALAFVFGLRIGGAV